MLGAQQGMEEGSEQGSLSLGQAFPAAGKAASMKTSPGCPGRGSVGDSERQPGISAHTFPPGRTAEGLLHGASAGCTLQAAGEPSLQLQSRAAAPAGRRETIPEPKLCAGVRNERDSCPVGTAGAGQPSLAPGAFAGEEAQHRFDSPFKGARKERWDGVREL